MNRRDLFKLAFGAGVATIVPLAVGKPASVWDEDVIAYSSYPLNVCLCDTAFECSACDAPVGLGRTHSHPVMHYCGYCNGFFTSAHYCEAERWQLAQGSVHESFTLA